MCEWWLAVLVDCSAVKYTVGARREIFQEILSICLMRPCLVVHLGKLAS